MGIVDKIKASPRPLTLSLQLPPGVAKYAAELATLREMGFADPGAALAALEASGGDVEQARIRPVPQRCRSAEYCCK